MMNVLFPILALLGGAAVAVQSQINGGLGKKVGVLEGSFISFGIGTVALFFVVVFFGKGDLLAVTSLPKWQLLGGILGAFFVIVNVLAVPKIGVAATLIAVTVGQILLSAIIDHFGFFGGQRYPLDGRKLIALALLFFAVFLYNKH